MDHEKDKAIFEKIDHRLAEETTLEEGLARAVEAGRMTQAEADECMYAYMQSNCETGKLVNNYDYSWFKDTPPL